MSRLSRRHFIHHTTLASLAAAPLWSLASVAADEPPKRKMTMDLVCGNLGISTTQAEAVDLAARHGFESVEANLGYLMATPADELKALQATMKARGIVFGAAGFPFEFRQDQRRFEEGLKFLPKYAAGLQRASVDRMGTWLNPGHDKLPYLQNFHQHASRLKEIARVLQEHGVRLGLEYVAPRTSWVGHRYTFIHTMAEMRDLIGDIGLPNVGLVLDSWHWWHAGDTAADILALKGGDVIAVDLNDAPAGVPKEQMPDNRRELPGATGIIDVGAFLNALNQIGYDGPVRAEPFDRAINKMPHDDSAAAAAAALKKCFALIHESPIAAEPPAK